MNSRAVVKKKVAGKVAGNQFNLKLDSAKVTRVADERRSPHGRGKNDKCLLLLPLFQNAVGVELSGVVHFLDVGCGCRSNCHPSKRGDTLANC